jgi:hypothetical protein
MAKQCESKRDARTLLATWLLLMALTLGSFWLARSNVSNAEATAGLLGAAVLKSLLIASIYMEMRRGPVVWAAVMSGFLLGEAGLILVILP